MATKDKIKDENPHINFLFSFNSFKCECNKEIHYSSPGEFPKETIKVAAHEDEPINFSFAPQKGLFRIQPSSSLGSNVLGRFISINNPSIDAYIPFFEENGFLFPVPSKKFEELEAFNISEISTRLRVTLNLLNYLGETQRTNYEKVLNYALFLLLKPVTSKVKLSTYEYSPFVPSLFSLMLGWNNVNEINTDKEAFESGKVMVKDSIYGSYSLDMDLYQRIMDGNNDDPSKNDQFYRGIVYLYKNGVGLNDEERSIIDFLFHYYTDVGVVKDLSSDSFDYYGKENDANFTPVLKNALLDFAKEMVKEEIDSNIKGIKPVYDKDKMAPEWNVDSLLSAMYFSLFFMNPSMELWKKCENPRCGQYFCVSRSDTKKKYCSPECRNNAMQARYRAKHAKKD